MYYNVKDPLSEAVLSEEQVLELIENNIKIVEKSNFSTNKSWAFSQLNYEREK